MKVVHPSNPHCRRTLTKSVLDLVARYARPGPHADGPLPSQLPQTKDPHVTRARWLTTHLHASPLYCGVDPLFPSALLLTASSGSLSNSHLPPSCSIPVNAKCAQAIVAFCSSFAHLKSHDISTPPTPPTGRLVDSADIANYATMKTSPGCLIMETLLGVRRWKTSLGFSRRRLG